MIDLILDAGHGGRDPGAIGYDGILKEKDCTLYIVKKCEEILKAQGINVDHTRDEDEYISLNDRAEKANSLKAKYFISIHINSADVNTAKGIEIFTLDKGGEGEKLSTNILDSVLDNTALISRGIKFANFTVLRETEMPAILIEVCFISNIDEEKLLKTDEFKDKIALSICKGFLNYLGLTYKEYRFNKLRLTPIICDKTAEKDQAKQFAKNNNATDTFIALADLYWDLGVSFGGINPVMAYCQAALETNYGRFDNEFNDNYKNPCRLKIVSSLDDSSGAYMTFDNWRDGVCAHLDHLALYAGAEGYPKNKTKDPRHFSFLLGKVKFVEQLVDNWDSDPEYSNKILSLMDSVSKTSVEDNFNDDYFQKEKNEEITKKSLSTNEHLYNNKNYKSDNDNNDDLISIIKNNVNEINDKLNNFKQRCMFLDKIVEQLENKLNIKEEKIKELEIENAELKEKIRSYREIIEDILDIVNGKFK